jgi:hypothetical protein
MTLALLTQPETYVSLLTLTAMEVVLGIDTLRRTCRGTRTNRATTGDDGAPGYRTELLTRCTQRGTERGVTCVPRLAQVIGLAPKAVHRDDFHLLAHRKSLAAQRDSVPHHPLYGDLPRWRQGLHHGTHLIEHALSPGPPRIVVLVIQRTVVPFVPDNAAR